MSYIENRISIEDYLDSIKEKSKKNHVGSILNQFNLFCKQNFNRTHQQVIDDIKKEITKTNSNDKIYVLFNKYKDWLSQDHPEITYYTGKYSKHKNTIKKRHPNSIKQYISKMRNIFEEIGNIEINNRIFNKRVRIAKAEEEDPEPFTKEQMRLLLDRCSNHNKLKYMVLKDSGMRVGELTQIRKRDINITKTPIEIIAEGGGIIETLAFSASAQGEIHQPWIIPQDLPNGIYTFQASDAFNSDSTTFEVNPIQDPPDPSGPPFTEQEQDNAIVTLSDAVISAFDGINQLTDALNNELAPALLQLQTDVAQLTTTQNQIIDGVNNELIQLNTDVDTLQTDVDNLSPTLSKLNCTIDQIAQFDGIGWICSDVPISTISPIYTITGYVGSGNGFSGGITCSSWRGSEDNSGDIILNYEWFSDNPDMKMIFAIPGTLDNEITEFPPGIFTETEAPTVVYYKTNNVDGFLAWSLTCLDN